MISRNMKMLFYAVAGPIMKFNGFFHYHFKGKSKANLKIHLGPGQKKYIEGWCNLDANIFSGKVDVWVDLRNRIPFEAGSAEAVYSHHVIEHLPDLRKHFADVYRVLKPGGVYRVGGPNGDVAIRKFVERDLNWFGVWPDRYESIGGRFANFIFCRNEHLTILTESFMQELAQEAGFKVGNVMHPKTETGRPDIFSVCLALENDEPVGSTTTLILEFEK